MDARQRVSPAQLARYMEHARWQAITQRALGFGELLASGLRIVVRAQDLHVGAALIQDVPLRLSVAVARVGNSSFVLAQRVLRETDQSEVARSFVTAVVIDASGRPTRVPEALRAHRQAIDVDAPLSCAEGPPRSAFAMAVQVRASDLDTLLHVNQSRYLDYVDDTRAQAAHAGAIAGTAAASPSRIMVDYRRETVFGAALSAQLWPLAGHIGALVCDLHDTSSQSHVARAILVM